MDTPNPPDNSDIAVLAWKRLTGNGSRRTPDGERDVVVMSTDDFIHLVALAEDRLAFVVECKARQNLNVTRTLAKTRQKLERRKQGR